MKKILCLVLVLAFTLSIFAGPIISVSNNTSSNISEQGIKDLVAQKLGYTSLEDIQNVGYIYIAVDEDSYIYVDIDGKLVAIQIDVE
jgi:hypothetical protein